MRIEPNYLVDALSYSSKRRLMFVRLYQEIGRELGFRQLSDQFIFEVLERIHSSASIIDDMLDNEAVRKDFPSYYIRHGKAVAGFAALNLMISAIEELNKNASEIGSVMECLREMIDAEEADLALRERVTDSTPLEWYRRIVSKKIAGELGLILTLCTLGEGSNDKTVQDLVKITCRLGQFIQYADDHFDILVRDPFARVRGEHYVLTYSLPLAVYMTENDHIFEEFIGVRISRSLAREILIQLQHEKNVLSVETFIHAEHTKLVDSIGKLSLKSAPQLAAIAQLVKTKAYWETEYYEINT
jgi:Polyprenyl synthetase